jgi:chemotaxis signal transduction protein
MKAGVDLRLSTPPLSSSLFNRKECKGGHAMNDGKVLQLATFKLDHKEFGLNAVKVEEVNEIIDTTRILNGLGFVEGFIDLRGRVTTALDLQERCAAFLISGIESEYVDGVSSGRTDF